MKLDSHITSEFSDMINELYSEPTEQTVYGVAKEMAGVSGFGVLLDGAENPIPVESAVTLSNDDRVQVVIQNHKATVVANMTDKSITETKTDEAISAASTTIIQEVIKEVGYKYYIYSNGSNINIADSSSAIVIRFSFEMEKADYITFHGQIQCNIALSSGSDQAIVKAYIYVNGTKIGLEPTETWGNGNHVFSLDHIFTSGITDSGSLIVYLETTGGSVNILNKQIIAWLSSIGATGQGGAFDGLLTVEETYNIISIDNDITVKGYSDTVSTQTQLPNTNGLTDTYSEIIMPDIQVVNYIDRLSPINNYTEDVINYLDAGAMVYDSNYVYINDQNRFALIDTTSPDQVAISPNYIAIHPSIIGIEDVSIDADTSTLFAVSFDDGTTWWNYISNEWVTVAQSTSGQDVNSIESISTNAWAEKFANGDSIKFRFVLTGNGYLDNITIHYIN